MVRVYARGPSLRGPATLGEEAFEARKFGLTSKKPFAAAIYSGNFHLKYFSFPQDRDLVLFIIEPFANKPNRAMFI